MRKQIDVELEVINELHLRPWERTRCSANVGPATARWRMHIDAPKRCKHNVMFLVNGKKMCERHAGRHLLEQVLDKSLSEVKTKEPKK